MNMGEREKDKKTGVGIQKEASRNITEGEILDPRHCKEDPEKSLWRTSWSKYWLKRAWSCT